MITAEQLQAAKRELGLKSFYHFVLMAFKAVNPTTVFKDNWHIEYLCGELQEEALRIIAKETRPYKWLIINVPPRSLKSEIASVYLPIWTWLQDTSFPFIFSSYSGSLSNELSEKSKNIIRSPWFEQLYADKVQILRGKDRVQDWGIVGGGVRLSTSTDGTITGKGGLMVVQDDPQDPKRAASETERKTTIAFNKETLPTRLNDPEIGLFVVIMQRLHEGDVTGWLLSDPEKKVKHICIPAEYDAKNVKLPGIEKYPHLNPYNGYQEGALMFPERFTASFLAEQKTNLGSNGYAGQYGQTPTAPGGGLFKKESFQVITWEQFVQRTGNKKPVWDFFTDGAYTDKAENDPTAQGATTYFDNCVFIRHVAAERIDSAYLAPWIEKHVTAHGYTPRSFVNMEPKASGLTVISAVKRETKINIRAYKYPTKSGVTIQDDKITRANAAAPTVESGRVFLIAGPWVEPFLDEVSAFPRAKNDDRVDVLVMAILHYLFKKEEGGIEIY